MLNNYIYRQRGSDIFMESVGGSRMPLCTCEYSIGLLGRGTAPKHAVFCIMYVICTYCDVCTGQGRADLGLCFVLYVKREMKAQKCESVRGINTELLWLEILCS